MKYIIITKKIWDKKNFKKIDKLAIYQILPEIKKIKF